MLKISHENELRTEGLYGLSQHLKSALSLMGHLKLLYDLSDALLVVFEGILTATWTLTYLFLCWIAQLQYSLNQLECMYSLLYSDLIVN